LSLLPYDASFEELVHECFLAFRGFGLMLSPLDAELIADWRTQEIPFEVVARGMARGVERALWRAPSGGKPLFSLRSCQRQIDAEIRKFAARAAGKGRPEGGPKPQPLEVARHRRLCRSLKKLGKSPRWATAADRILAQIESRQPADLAESDRLEEQIYLVLLRGLPLYERIQLIRAVRQLNFEPGSTHRARKRARRFHLASLLKARLALPDFW
jgi:hypothetical protein